MQLRTRRRLAENGLPTVELLWIVLGVVLIALVALILYSFFVVRPRSTAQLQASVALLARETHGKPPDLLLPAKCESVSVASKQDVPGIGVVSVTDQGLVFAAANPDRTLIIARSDITATTSSGPGGGARTAARVTVQWRRNSGDEAQITFTLAHAQALLAALAPAN